MPGPNSLVVVFFLLFIFIHVTFLPTSTQAQVSHSTPRHKLKRRSKSSNSVGSSSDNKFVVNTRHYNMPTYNWEQKEYVKAHNDLREESGVPPLQWHPDLANSSNNWANELQDTCDYRHHSKGVYGENIFWALYKEFTPTDVVRKWFSEKMHFDHTTNLCKCQPETDKCECGHYLNVVWKTSQWVGCSNAIYCKGAKGLIVVCQYDPPGNYKGLDPLNPKFSGDDDEDDDKEEKDHGVPPPPPPPPPQPLAINTNHAASSSQPRPPPRTSINNNHRASIHPSPPPPINNSHRASGQSSTPAINTNHGASSGHPPLPSTSINNNQRASRHHQQSPTSMKSPKVSGPPAPPIVNGSRESHVTHHKNHTPRHKGDIALE